MLSYLINNPDTEGIPRQLLDFFPKISNNNPVVFEMAWLHIVMYKNTFCIVM